MRYCTELEEIIKKIHMEPQKTLNSLSNLEKNKVGGIMLPDIKLLQGHSNQNSMHTVQWNRIESPEINQCLSGQLIFYKGHKMG